MPVGGDDNGHHSVLTHLVRDEEIEPLPIGLAEMPSAAPYLRLTELCFSSPEIPRRYFVPWPASNIS